MSTSDLYRVYRTRATHVAEMQNGWGTGPVVWRHLVIRFLGRDPHDYLRDNDQELYRLAFDPRVPRPLRLAQAFCADLAFCPFARLEEFADACRAVYDMTSNGRQVNHWATIASLLRGLRKQPRQLGVALSCTSICDPWLHWRPQRTGKPWDIFAYIEQRAAA